MTIINPSSNYGTVTIVGVGLIGASLGLALKKQGLSQKCSALVVAKKI